MNSLGRLAERKRIVARNYYLFNVTRGTVNFENGTNENIITLFVPDRVLTEYFTLNAYTSKMILL